MHIQDEVRLLPGVGPQKMRKLAHLKIVTLKDLLYHFPRRYLDLSQRVTLDTAPFQTDCTVCATVERVGAPVMISGGRTILKAIAVEEVSGMTLEVAFFNLRFAPKGLVNGATLLFHGKIDYKSPSVRSMTSPQLFPAHSGVMMMPLYRLTAGITDFMMRTMVQSALSCAGELPEILPEEIRALYNLPDVFSAIEQIHCPSHKEKLLLARKRFMFEELFVLAAGMGLIGKRNQRLQGVPLEGDVTLSSFYSRLPFSLTGAQQRCIGEALEDLRRDTPANRLIQGDVGSGKTMVCAAGAYYAFTAGAQIAMMAPTELLARQHFHTMESLLSPLGVTVALLTGSLTPKQKQAIYDGLAAGSIDFAVGTHALFSKGVSFAKLGLVITDEQHRFGVAQREALRKKGITPHTFVLSATPIPRTLALMLYGELSLSVLDELPPGRQTIETYKADDRLRGRVYQFLRRQLDEGRQGYIVCPLVSHTEDSDLTLCAAEKLYGDLSADRLFAGCRLGLLHGKMKPRDKEAVMCAFSAGEIQLLISTTVVEVGVDVPNAVVMMIENAERFGLSQLHQLRGRVGRGKHQSYCILLSNAKSSAALERISFLCKTNDGFRLAEYDLQTRGPGNFLGSEQHGLPELRLADLATDPLLVEQARSAAIDVLQKDPLLQHHPALAAAVEQVLETVGERPN